jgi:hypothetical protein
MNATIIYLKDSDEKAGKVEISVEVIGDPVQSFLLADDLMRDLSQADGTYLVRESVFISSPTDQIQ